MCDCVKVISYSMIMIKFWFDCREMLVGEKHINKGMGHMGDTILNQ